MKIQTVLSFLLFALLAACAPAPSTDAPSAPAEATPEPTEAPPAAPAVSPQDEFWQHITDLCGKAFGGDMVTDDPRDADFVGWAFYMHVRRCSEDRIEIPFTIGEDRSRTWVLTRTEAGLKLEHDHRHEDGTPDKVTLYGGTAKEPGTATLQEFPVDNYTHELFEVNELIDSMLNVWSLEIVPGERFSYILKRPGRYFRADFDLQFEVPAPPPPWGH